MYFTPAFVVKLSSSGGSSTLSVVTDEIADLGDLMKETKRLADVAGKVALRRTSRWRRMSADKLKHSPQGNTSSTPIAIHLRTCGSQRIA